MKRMTLAVCAALLAAACGSYSTSPYGVSGGGGGGVGGGAGGGPVGHVTVGNNFFQSAHNGTLNEAVDTISAGSTVTWSWAASGSHSIQSTGTQPDVFRNSVVMSSSGSSYAVMFSTPGTYTYDCSIHGAAMSGRIVVQ